MFELVPANLLNSIDPSGGMRRMTSQNLSLESQMFLQDQPAEKCDVLIFSIQHLRASYRGELKLHTKG